MPRSVLLRCLLVATFAAGCGVDALSVGGSEVLIPDQVPVVWDVAYNGVGDGLGALVPVDVMAYDGATGEPLPGLEVHVWTADDAATPIPPNGVVVLDGEIDLASTLVSEAIDPWAAKPVGPPEFEFWDALHDQFVAVAFGGVDFDLRTDEGGVARLYLFVDAFREREPGEKEGGLAPIQVVVAVGDDETVFSLVPR